MGWLKRYSDFGRYSERPIALTADIKSIFPNHARKCLMFLWRPGTNLFRYTKISVKYLQRKNLQLKQVMLSSEWDSIVKKCIQTQQRRYKITSTWTFLYINKITRKSKQNLQLVTTSSLTTWVSTAEINEQQRQTYCSNPRWSETDQQHEASWSGIHLGGVFCACSTMEFSNKTIS